MEISKIINHIENRIKIATLSSNIDIISPEFIQNPHSFCLQLRQKSPIRYLKKQKGWLLMDYDDVVTTLTQSENFSTAPYKQHDEVLLGIYSPEHTHLRHDILNEYFSKKRVIQLQEIAKSETLSLFEEIIKTQEFDLYKDIAKPLINNIIGRFLGLNPLKMTELTSIGQQLNQYKSQEVLKPFISGSGIIKEMFEDERLSQTQTISLISIFLAAGIGSTQKALCNAIYVLLSFPKIMNQVKNNYDLIPSLIEELLRLEPINIAIPRMATKQIKFNSTTIAPGSLVYASIPAANRDPKKFTQPDQIILDRKSPKPIIFGLGVHQCIGKHLAMLQLQIIIEAILIQLPTFKSSESINQIKFSGYLFERGIQELKLKFV